MRNSTRLVFNKYLDQQAKLNGVSSATQKFDINPSIQQRLENRIQESSSFLQQINIVPVTEQEGEVLGLGISGAIASRTNTRNGTPRQPKLVGNVSRINRYKCAKTDFDTAMRYEQIDLWARYPDFQNRVRDMVVNQQALDRILIGFHGKRVEEDSDPDTYPMRDDINIGWLENIRQNAPEHWLFERTPGSGQSIRIGAGGEYNNLDALVVDSVNNLIDPLYSSNPNLVCIVGRNLMNDKLFPLVNNVDKPTEILAAQALMGQGRLGGLAPVRAPYFPDNAILITALDNLSLYWQEGARRRSVVDEANLDRVVNYDTSNDAYVIENLDAICFIENIELL